MGIDRPLVYLSRVYKNLRLRLKTLRPHQARIKSDLNPRVLFSGSCAGCAMIVIGLKLSITRQRKNLTGLVECVVTPNGVAV
jgi:hypothetical protein